jgi:4-hydroxy-tetrahydrodipicolinate reductase
MSRLGVGIVGFGRMGREVERAARARGHRIEAVFEEDSPLRPDSRLEAVDVLIDFSTAAAVRDVLSTAAARRVPVVEGTTGWWEQLDDVLRLPGLTMIHSPNFSLGVYQFSRLVQAAARLLGRLDYDAYVHEWHHAGKADSPSGTARQLAERLLAALPSKDRAVTATCERRIEPFELHVTSTRVGRVPGTHEVGFDSAVDSIILRHEAHGRQGFAHGAVLAAEWIVGRRGIFTMEDFVGPMTEGEL